MWIVRVNRWASSFLLFGIRFSLLVVGATLLLPGCPAEGYEEQHPTTPASAMAEPALATTASVPQPRPRLTPPPPARRSPAPVASVAPARPAEFRREVKRLFATMFCVGRGDDWPCQLLSHELRRIRNQYTLSVKRWFNRRRPASAPKTVLYPFSGGDLATVMAAYGPGQRFYHLSLEHGGPPDPLVKMNATQRHKARLVFVRVARDLATHSFNFSEVLQAQEKAGVPGILPLLLTGLRLHRGRPTGLRYFQLTPQGKLHYLTREDFSRGRSRATNHAEDWPVPRMDARFANLELRFRLPGDKVDRVVRHVSANLSNKGLARRPEVVRYLAALGPHSLMVKANSWLLRSKGFSTMRRLAFHRTRFFAADTVDAPPPAWLKKRGFRVWVYGAFECFISAPHLAEVWRLEFLEQEKRSLPFRFGYQDCQERNSLVLGSRIR